LKINIKITAEQYENICKDLIDLENNMGSEAVLLDNFGVPTIEFLNNVRLRTLKKAMKSLVETTEFDEIIQSLQDRGKNITEEKNECE
jgi:endo-1,4-beta-mannosidase